MRVRYIDKKGVVPTKVQLAQGEVIINRVDSKLYFKDLFGNVKSIGNISSSITNDEVQRFIDNADTPQSYGGNASKFLAVNSAETAIEFVDAPSTGTTKGKNLLINGNFFFWQRGTTFTGSNIYTSDRWKIGDITGADKVSIPSNEYNTGITTQDGIRLKQTVTKSASYTVMSQKIEMASNHEFRGKTFTLSFKAECNAIKSNFQVQIKGFVNSFNTFTSTAQSFAFASANTMGTFEFQITFPDDFDALSEPFVSTTSYVEVSILDSGDYKAFELDMFEMQFEDGATYTEFEHVPYSIAYLQCRRFYKTIDYPVVGAITSFNTSRALFPVDTSDMRQKTMASTDFKVLATSNALTMPMSETSSFGIQTTITYTASSHSIKLIRDTGLSFGTAGSAMWINKNIIAIDCEL